MRLASAQVLLAMAEGSLCQPPINRVFVAIEYLPQGFHLLVIQIAINHWGGISFSNDSYVVFKNPIVYH